MRANDIYVTIIVISVRTSRSCAELLHPFKMQNNGCRRGGRGREGEERGGGGGGVVSLF